jgi:hypothetical protein
MHLFAGWKLRLTARAGPLNNGQRSPRAPVQKQLRLPGKDDPMHVLRMLLVLLCGTLLLPCAGGCAEQPAEKKAAGPTPAEQPTKREALRYDGKTFEQWRTILLSELKPSRQVEALGALRAFAARGYAAEASAATVAFMENYNFSEAEVDPEQQKVEAAAVDVIVKGGLAARPEILRALDGKSRGQRLFALRRVTGIFWNDPGLPLDIAMPAVARLALDSDPAVRTYALKVLLLHHPQKGTLAALDKAVKDNNSDIRAAAVTAIGEDRPFGDKTLIPLLLASLADKEEQVRLAAARALVRAGSRDMTARTTILRGSKEIPGLLAALTGDSPKVRLHIVESLASPVWGNWGNDDEYLQAFKVALKDPDPAVRTAAAEALKKAGE